MNTKDNALDRSMPWIYRAGFFIILILPLLFFQPWFIPPDFAKTLIFRSIVALMLLCLAYQQLWKRPAAAQTPLKQNKIALALGALLLVFFIASVFSVDPQFSFWGSPIRSGGFVNIAAYIMFAILSWVLLKKEDWQKAWMVSIGIGALVSLIAIFQYHAWLQTFFMPSGRPASTMGNPILLAMYLVLLFFITLAFSINELKKPGVGKKIFYFLALVLFLYGILISGSRAGYLGILTGGLYFLIFYPKRMIIVKAITVLGVAGVIAGVWYINTTPQYPAFLEHNKLFDSIAPRLSWRLLLADGRFYAWSNIDLPAIKDRPLLGYGPENFYVGFNQHYDPSIPYLSRDWGDWWDRAHNVIIQTASDTGILGLASYLALLLAVFWCLGKPAPSQEAQEAIDNKRLAHGLRATLIGYVTADLFSFDSFGTYLIFFLLIGYAMYLVWPRTTLDNQTSVAKPKGLLTPATVGILALVVLVFLWHYNVVPFIINTNLANAKILASQQRCDSALTLAEKTADQQGIMGSYARLTYAEFTKTCNDFYPQNILVYLKKDIELINQAAAIQPLYTRYWILLGNSTATLAQKENDSTKKTALLNQGRSYLQKALVLGPKYQEIPIEQARLEMIAGNYQKAADYANRCIQLNENLGDCWWQLGLTQIYLNNILEGQQTLIVANKNGYPIDSQDSLIQLADVYYTISDWKDLIVVYEKLIVQKPNVPQYHSSLAFFYSKVGRYADARREALEVLKISPESKPNVDAFLKSLPQ